MEPIGTITKYFPFIGSEVREYVIPLMKVAENYSNFVERLCERICWQKVHPKIAMFAMKHVANLLRYDLGMKIVSKYEHLNPVRAWRMWGDVYIGKAVSRDAAFQTIDAVLATPLEAWLSIEMLLLKSHLLHRTNPRESLRVLTEVEIILKSRDELNCFKTDFYRHLGGVYYILDDYEKCTEAYESALRLANEYDDLFSAGWALNGLGMSLSISEAKRIDFFTDAQEIFKQLGFLHAIPTLLNNIGFSFVSLGEYDQALECYLESNKLFELAYGIPNYYATLNISVLYGNLGETEKALNHAKKVLTFAKKRDPGDPAPYTEMGRALILSGRLQDAFEYLETGGELAFKVGSKKELARYYLVRGMFDREKGDIESAVLTLQRGLRIAEDIDNFYHTLQILLHLAEAEVVLYANEGRKHATNPEIALSRLEQIAREQNLPGLLVQMILLRAELQMIQGRKEKARTYLKDALQLCDSSALSSLRQKVLERFDSLDMEESSPSLLKRFKELVRQIAIPIRKAHKIPFEVLGCIMILRGVGLELYSKYVDKRLISDPSLVAGLISAVSSFTLQLKEDAKGQLQSIIHQDIAVLLEHGERVTCALLTDKDTYDARVLGRRFLDKFEETFHNTLTKFDGDISKFQTAKDLFMSIFLKGET
ncbi:MAG: tetratricopeptide repeat protein [Candidatus Hodarchaeota archaeon]